MPKLTLEEKRRETLRRQLYGKEEPPVIKHTNPNQAKSDSSKTYSISSYETSSPNSQLLTTNYLTRDLTKILIFSALALGTQFILFFLLQNHIVKLPF